MMEHTDDVNSDIYPVTDWRQTDHYGSRGVVLEHVVRAAKASKRHQNGGLCQGSDG
jgi:hypothetical protein